jgi:hypothetical protein
VDENAGTIEGPNLHFHSTSKEGAFWTRFSFSHPHPPDDIEAQQQHLAESILGTRFDFEYRGNPARTNPKWMAEAEKSQKDGAIAAGYPPEALTEESLFWAYVLKSRSAYQSYTDTSTGQPVPWATNFLAQVLVPTNYIAQPLDADQMKAANSWKLEYVRRLRREKTDGSYISAYLKAWNLTEEEVSSGN